MGRSSVLCRPAALAVALLVASAALAQTPPLPDALGAQIAALQAEKAARTPAQRKLSSQLLHALRLRRGEPPAPGIPTLRTGVEVDAEGAVRVDVRGEITPALLDAIAALGGRVLASFPSRNALRARIPLLQVEELAARPELRGIRQADRAFTRKVDTSEGDGAHYADDARSSLGIDGSGVSVGVLSDGVDSLVALQITGDLPAVTVLPGQAGSGSEGTAMLEIVFDLAPGAALLFATAFQSQASFASNIVALRNAGADVIVDDVGYFAEAALQDDDVAAAVDQVVADGAIYLSAAGNSGNLNDGTAGVWEGDFAAGPSFRSAPAHDYGGDIRNTITVDSPFLFTLQWSDALGASGNDYDLYLAGQGGGQIIAASTSVQDGNDDPFEAIDSFNFNDANRTLIVVRSSGAGRFLHLNAHRGRLEHRTAGQTWGHAAARGALGVAAVDARGRSSGFTGSEPVETYSSDGPRRIFYEADGTPITPGDLSSSGGELRQKPDLAGADCVDTHTPGFNTFCGTSAAAPHLAAVAALLLERGGGPAVADPDDVRVTLAATALDIEAAGADRDSGAGIVEALAAANAMPTPECTIDADCDDGLFCTGAETCDAGSCAAGPPPVCEGATPFCDEGADACSECLAAGDCDDGLFCNGAETCTAGSCGSGSAPLCEAPTPLCDEGAMSCAECLDDGDCAAGFCDAGTCAPPPPIPASPSGRGPLLIAAGLLLAGAWALRRRGREVRAGGDAGAC